MRNATKRPIKDYPHLSWEALPEGVACVEIAKQVQEEVDSEAVSCLAAEAVAGGVGIALGGLFVGRGGAAVGGQSQHFAGIFARIAGEIRGFFGV